jgi:HEPN superfamily Swt1-like protein
MFKGLALEQSLDRIEREGIGLRPESTPGSVQRVIPLEDFSLPVRQASMAAMPAYLSFFCLENSVRELVSDRLSEANGSDWWGTCASTGMKKQVEDRKTKEGKNRWHVERGAHEINYTTFGDLRDLIVTHWAVFQDLFPDQNWISSRLDELEASRNIIAHSNILDDRELTRLRLYLQDWIRQVG